MSLSDNAPRASHAKHAARKKNPKIAVLAITISICVVATFASFVVFTFVQQPPSLKSHSQNADDVIFDKTIETAAALNDQADNIIFTMPGARDTYVLKGEEYLEPGCFATQNKADDITSSIVTEGKVDTSTEGDYEISYTAKNSDGKIASVKRNVHVVGAMDERASSIPVLMYHYVYDPASPPAKVNANFLSTSDFSEQLQYLSDANFYFPSFQEVRAFSEGKHTLPARSVVLTFDDGEENFMNYGIPLLNKYKIPATSFAITDDFAGLPQSYATEFVQFQSHTYNMHRPGGGQGKGGIIYKLSREEIMDDIAASNKVTPGEKAVALAYPFGDNTETAWRALEDSGILCAFTVKNGRVSPGDNPMALNRVRINAGISLDSYIGLVAPK